MNAAEVTLFGFGYPASLAVIARFVAVVRDRRWRWLVVHHLGVAAIIAGFASRRSAVGMAVNASWFVVSSAWYVVAGRQRQAAGGGR